MTRTRFTHLIALLMMIGKLAQAESITKTEARIAAHKKQWEQACLEEALKIRDAYEKRLTGLLDRLGKAAPWIREEIEAELAAVRDYKRTELSEVFLLSSTTQSYRAPAVQLSQKSFLRKLKMLLNKTSQDYEKKLTEMRAAARTAGHQKSIQFTTDALQELKSFKKTIEDGMMALPATASQMVDYLAGTRWEVVALPKGAWRSGEAHVITFEDSGSVNGAWHGVLTWAQKGRREVRLIHEDWEQVIEFSEDMTTMKSFFINNREAFYDGKQLKRKPKR